MVLLWRRCGSATGHSRKQGWSKKGAIFGFLSVAFFSAKHSTVQTQVCFWFEVCLALAVTNQCTFGEVHSSADLRVWGVE